MKETFKSIITQLAYTWIFFVVFTLLNVYIRWDQSYMVYILPSSYIQSIARFRIETWLAMDNTSSFTGVLQVLSVYSTKFFLAFGQEVAILITSLNMLPFLSVEPRLPDWLKSIVNNVEGIESSSNHSQHNNDQPPPLEEIDPTLSLFPVIGICIFHPVYGVIPKETYLHWVEEEQMRNQLQAKLRSRHQQQQRLLPPVRYSICTKE